MRGLHWLWVMIGLAAIDTPPAMLGNSGAFTIPAVDSLPSVTITRRYVYDGHHHLCKIIEPETGSTVIGYDTASNENFRASGLDLPSTTNCDHMVAWNSGRRVVRTYDARNRVTSLRFPDGRGDQDWTYTPDGLPATVLTSNDGPDVGRVHNAYSYNARRQLVGEALHEPGWTWSIGYGYDRNGHLIEQVNPDSSRITYAVNALGQTIGMTGTSGTYVSGATYYPNGALKQFTYGNGFIHTLDQNVRGMPERSRDAYAGVAVLDDSYDFDATGNVAAISDGATGRNQRGNRSMAYDGLDRLVSTTSPMFGTATYGYDPLDNLTRVHVSGGLAPRDHHYCYDIHNRLTNVKTGGCGSGASVIGLGFDVQGNLANRNGQLYAFDYGNRLREATGKEAYRYDTHGRRSSAIDPTLGTIRSFYNRDGQLSYQHDGRLAKSVAHVHLAGSLVATREQSTTTGVATLKYHHTDALGTPVVVTDTNRNVVERSEYEPYGKLLNRPVKDGVGYTGHVEDAQTGLTYMQQRYMDPLLGVFTSVDAVTAHGGDLQHFNRFAYAYNNPYKFTDPDGRQSREFNFENRRLDITPPPRSEKDWLGPVIGYALAGMLAAPVAAEAYLAMLANPITATNVAVGIGEAAGVTGAASGGALAARATRVGVPTIGGRLPINSKYAGQVHPRGIRFTDQGFPDFGPVSKARAQIQGLTGSYAKDAAMANQAVGLKATPSGYVWHHVEDGATMQLVPRSIHNATKHTGGAATIRNGGFDP